MDSHITYLRKEGLKNLIFLLNIYFRKKCKLLKIVEDYAGDDIDFLYFYIYKNINLKKLTISLLEQKDLFTTMGILFQGLRAEKNNDVQNFFNEKDKTRLIEFILAEDKKDFIFYDSIKNLISLLSVIPSESHKIILDYFVDIFQKLYPKGGSKTQDIFDVLQIYEQARSPFKYHCEAFLNEHLRVVDEIVVKYALGAHPLPIRKTIVQSIKNTDDKLN